MGFKDLQVLILLVWLCLGHTLVESIDNSRKEIVPNSINTSPLWNVSSGSPVAKILQSSNTNFSFDLMFTNGSKDSCAAVVRHVSNTTVWVANFNSTDNSNSSNPVQTCSLSFRNDTGLELLGSNGNNSANWRIWATNLGRKNIDILLLDENGILHIKPKGETSQSVWKSVDYPGNTLIKGHALGRNERMEAAQLNREYSTGGIFSMRIEDSNLTLHQAFNASGTVVDITYMSFPTGSPGNKEKSSFMRIDNGSVAFYGEGNESSPAGGNYDYARLESDGGLVLRAYDGRSEPFNIVSDSCRFPAFCESSGNCSSGVNCTCPSEGFKKLYNESGHFGGCVPLPLSDCKKAKLVNVTAHTYWNTSEGVPLNRAQCETSCLNDCDCNIALHVAANGNPDDPDGKCFLKLDSLRTIRVEESREPQTLFLRIPAPEESSRRTAASAFAGGAGAFVLLLLGASAWWLVITRRRIFDAADRGAYDAAVAAAAAGKPPPQQLPPRYSYQALEVSTSGFRHVFGKSSVYFGTLPHHSDTKIAVKALDDRGHRDKDFLAAVATMGRLSHPNLVPLLGYCKEGKHKMLVYELVNEGKSLSWLLFDAGAPMPDAATRRAIALGVARGLQHLDHHGVLHGGVKPENILIDAHRHPKLVDYGLVGLWTRFKALQAADARCARGYMAPESLHEGPLTAKADVYSLGVVMLELVSGRRCLVPDVVPEERRYLPAWGLAVLRRHHNDLDSAVELVDPRLNAHALSETDLQVLKGMACVALCCVQADPALRPSMDEVVLMLNSELAVNAPLSSPTLDDYTEKLCTATQLQQGFLYSPSLSENSDMRLR